MKLIKKNNLYLVELETNLSKNSLFVIDTSSKDSFIIKENIEFVCINNKKYSLHKKTDTHLRNMINQFDNYNAVGFIGLDILKQTGLTLDFKNNTIEFAVNKGHILSFINDDNDFLLANNLLVNNHNIDKILIDSTAIRSYVLDKYISNSEIINDFFVDDLNFSYGSIKGYLHKTTLNKCTLGSGDYGHYIEVCELLDENNIHKFDAILRLEDLILNENILAPNKIVSFDYESKCIYIN